MFFIILFLTIVIFLNSRGIKIVMSYYFCKSNFILLVTILGSVHLLDVRHSIHEVYLQSVQIFSDELYGTFEDLERNKSDTETESEGELEEGKEVEKKEDEEEISKFSEG